MRASTVATSSLALSLAALLTACSVGLSGNREGPFAAPPPPRPALFISPFGEPFMAEPGQPYPSADWFTGADDNLDGAITVEEFTADGQRYFASLDTDRDGRLNQTELAAYETTLRAFSMRGAGDGPGGGPRGPMGGGRGMAALPGVDSETLGVAPPSSGAGTHMRRRGRSGPAGYGAIADAGFFNLPQPVKSADINMDQRVSSEEWAQATQRWFLSLDTDRDGRLTLATLPVTPAQAAANRRR